MSANQIALGHKFGQVTVSDNASAHLGDKYGDTFHIDAGARATFYTFGPSQTVQKGDPVAGAVGFVQSAEATLTLGRLFLADVQQQQNDRPTLTDLLAKFTVVWQHTEHELQTILLDIAPRDHASNIDRFLAFQESHLDVLYTKLQAATLKLKKSMPSRPGEPNSPTAPNLVIQNDFFKHVLAALVTDTERWFAVFQAACQLLARLSDAGANSRNSEDQHDPHSDQTVITQIRHLIRQVKHNVANKSPPMLKEESFRVLTPLGPQPVVAWLASFREGTHKVVLNDTAYPQKNGDVDPPQHLKGEILRTVKDLAQLLSIADPFAVGLPRCNGIIKLSPIRFRYVLALPTDFTKAESLRSVLQMEEPSLSTRLDFARILSKAVMFLHSAETVHKSIRPDNIVVARSDRGEDLRKSKLFLIGFEEIRGQYAHSALLADTEWWKGIYRHPQRQGIKLQDFYNMQHDIYSLGVCLLEIGLWTNFVRFGTSQVFTEPRPDPMLSIDDFLQVKNKLDAARRVKDRLVDLARHSLPAKTGDTYARVVLSCLTCLDKGVSNMFDAEGGSYDEDGLMIGVAFIEKVLLKLEDIVV